MIRLTSAFLSIFLALGCTAPRPPLVVGDPDPGVKIPAIKLAVQRKNLSTAGQMVEDLNSDDPAVRFYAINGLRRLTGENFGYLYYEDVAARKPAVKRWKQWLASREGNANPEGAGRAEARPATNPSAPEPSPAHVPEPK